MKCPVKGGYTDTTARLETTRIATDAAGGVLGHDRRAYVVKRVAEEVQRRRGQRQRPSSPSAPAAAWGVAIGEGLGAAPNSLLSCPIMYVM